MANPKSTASMFGHPIHPMLVPFPIAFFVATFASDLGFWKTGDAFWFTASEWLLGAGLVMAALAAIAGLTDFAGEKKIQNLAAAWLHAGGNIVAVLIEVYNFYLRYTEGAPAVLFAGLVLSGVVVAVLLFTGWMGWEMVYRHQVGVADSRSSETIRVNRSYPEEKATPPYNRKPPPDAEHRV